jgi:hypothetical protein
MRPIFLLRRTAVIAPLLAVVVGSAVLTAPADATTRRVPSSSSDFSISISPDAIRVDAGGVASFPVRVRSASRVIPKPVFDVDGIPDSIDAEIERVTSSSYRLNLYVPANAPSSNEVYTLIGSANRRTRRAQFRLEVVGRSVVTAPPVTAPPVTRQTAPPAPVTQPTVTVVPVTQAPVFGIGIEGPERSGSTGESIGYPVLVDRSAGFGGPVQFTLSGLPASVQAGFLPNPSNGNTVLYLTPKSGTAAGRYVMTVVGTAGSTQRAAVLALTVKVTGEFAMIATPQSITRTSNGNAVYRIDIGTPLSDRPTISYTAEGSPAGTTVTFSANNTDARAINVTANVGAATANGTYNIVVTGRSGSVVRQIGLQLVVARPSSAGFGLAANPSTVTIARGGTANIILTVTPNGGFTGTINTGVTGLPTTVHLVTITNTTATANQPFTLTITLAADANAAIGSYTPFSITSTSGTLSASVPVGLIVT